MGVSVTNGIWVAQHNKVKATYSESRFGEQARLLAERAYQQMVAGRFDKVRDDFDQRQSYSMKEAALLLGLTEGRLHHWIRTGLLDGKEVKPPRKDTARGFKDRFNGCEIQLVKERLASR